MKSIEKAVTDIERDLTAVTKNAYVGIRKPISKVIEFVKVHRKMLLALAGVYVCLRYFLGDED